ncbi:MULTISPECIES: substrate-binding domain-containing protein [unclassified Mesorhizobium]
MKQALRLFRQTTRPEAVFCSTDFVAFEVLSVARELGLHVPGDVAIMGHDNTAFCDLSIAFMTSFDQSGPNFAQTRHGFSSKGSRDVRKACS